MELEIEFRQKLYKLYEENKRVLIPKDEYNKIINEIIEGSACSKKSPHQYYLLKKYEILKCGDVEKLIRKRQHPDEHPTYFVTIEETFDIVKRVHLATGHGGRDKMVKEANRKYANITQDVLSLYKSMCVECHRKRKRPATKGVVVRPLISKDFNSRAQVDLIDMQAMNQGHFKWIMVYQDHLTKFCVLRALTSKRASEVAYQLLDIFLLLGAPCVLQSDNGSEFTAKVIVELKELWPDLVMVHGKPRHPQSQGSVERANCDIKDMLVAWLGDNNTTDWTVGIKFVQFQKNASHHSGIKCSPFAALLGADAKIGLTSSSLPHDILSNIQSEDDLLATVTQTSTQSEPAPDATQPTSDDPDSREITPVPRETTAALGEISFTPSEPVSGTSEPDSSTETRPESTEPTQTEIESRQQVIQVNRKRANEAQIQQAERMVKRSKRIMSSVQIGDNVTVPIPHVDRGRADPRNLIGVVIECSDNELYTIAVKGGVLNGKYSRNQFDVCATALYSAQDVATDKHIPLGCTT